MESLSIWIIRNSPFALIFPLVVAVMRRKYLHRELRVIAIYLGVLIFFEGLSYVTAHMMHINNLPFLHLYTIIEFSVCAYFYHLHLGAFFGRRLVPLISIGFILFSIFNSIFIQDIYTYNSYALSLESVLLVGFAILTFYKMLQELQYTRMENSPIFWINNGFLFYFAGNLFLYILSNWVLAEDKQLSIFSWTLNCCLSILKQIFIAIGLWHTPRR